MVQYHLDMIEQYVEKGDDQGAHMHEDALYHNLIFSISKGMCGNTQTCCKLALTSREIDFDRWE